MWLYVWWSVHIHVLNRQLKVGPKALARQRLTKIKTIRTRVTPSVMVKEFALEQSCFPKFEIVLVFQVFLNPSLPLDGPIYTGRYRYRVLTTDMSHISGTSGKVTSEVWKPKCGNSSTEVRRKATYQCHVCVCPLFGGVC